MPFRHPADLPETPKKVEKLRPTVETGPGLTKQAHKRESDINVIVAKYQKTGVIEFANKNAPEYMAVEPIDFQEAMEKVSRANEIFEELPSQARKRFNNNPLEFMEFVHDPDNEDEMVELGLAVRRVDPGQDGIEGTADDKIVVDKTPGDATD